MKQNIHKKVFFVLVVIVLLLGTINIVQAKGWLIPRQPELEIKDNVVKLDSMTLEQKIAQMVIVAGLKDNYIPWRSMQVGGIHLFALQTAHIFNNTIVDFQYGMPIPFFVTADLEGCVTPFGHIKNFSAASEVETIGAAFEKGYREGQFLHELGFNLNFAPVVDLDDQIWNCRSFPGDELEIAEFAESYILGLQSQDVIATAKHYPGKTLVAKDPHKFVVAASISNEDVFPYEYLSSKADVRAIMVSHIISTGAVDSMGVPAVVSKEVISDLKENYNGLIISDEIHMLGLKDFYDSLDEMYIAVYNSGNDLILNFDRDPNEVHRMISVAVDAVRRGEVDEDAIDVSVTKILEAKGFIVR